MLSLDPRIDTRLLQLLISRLGEVQVQRPPVLINLPNLQPRDWLGQEAFEFRQVGFGSGPNFAPDIEVLFHFANTGRRDAGPFEIEAEVTTGVAGVTGEGTFTISVNNLSAGALATERITVLNHIPLNFFVGVTAHASLDKDPNQGGGKVWESDETDNEADGFLGFLPHVPVPKPGDGP